MECDRSQGKFNHDYMNSTRAKITEKYKQISFGRSQRSDFTKIPQQQDFANVSFYDVYKSSSFARDVVKNVKRNKDYTTFGATFAQYEKVYSHHMKYSLYGRGPSPNLGFETITTDPWMETM